MVAAIHPALQHCGAPRTPRPLPLFLDMVRDVAVRDPELARRVLEGMRLYGLAERPVRQTLPVATQVGRATLLQCGTIGPPVLLVPSLINPSVVLDLAEKRSLARFIAAKGYRVLLLDWGSPAADEANLDIAGHVERFLLPLIAQVGEPVHLVGYCLGGTMAIAAAALAKPRSLTLLATPWHYARYPRDAASELGTMWRGMKPSVEAMGLMPMEMLQPAFWSLDRERSVAKYAALAGRAEDDLTVEAFAQLEDWANDGAPLTRAVAEDLFERFIGADAPGSGQWIVAGRTIDPTSIACPAVHFIASNDCIAPSETAPDVFRSIICPSGHVGMIVGGRATESCWTPLTNWLDMH